MRRKRHLTSCNQAGFTLLEIVIAIMILAASLVTLLGLQSSSISRAIRDREHRRAMLLGRSIIAAIEVRAEPLEVQDTTGTIGEIFETIGVPVSPDLTRAGEGLQANIRVEDWDVPGIEQPSPMRRILVNIFWSDLPQDSLNLVYFIPNDPEIDNATSTPVL